MAGLGAAVRDTESGRAERERERDGNTGAVTVTGSSGEESNRTDARAFWNATADDRVMCRRRCRAPARREHEKWADGAGAEEMSESRWGGAWLWVMYTAMLRVWQCDVCVGLMARGEWAVVTLMLLRCWAAEVEMWKGGGGKAEEKGARLRKDKAVRKAEEDENRG